VHGFDTLVPELALAGVVCNKVASVKHYAYLHDAIAARCRPVPIGYLPRDGNFALPERHLGLHLAQEALTADRLQQLGEWIEAHLDLDRLLEISARPGVNGTPEDVKFCAGRKPGGKAAALAPRGRVFSSLFLPARGHQNTLETGIGRGERLPHIRTGESACPTSVSLQFVGRKAHKDGAEALTLRARIGIARDAAFCFYYHDNLELLRRLGAELVEFSPIADTALPPDLDGVYLGGGYPELHAEALSANESMRGAMAAFAASDSPVYAECGGFMYLMQAIVDVEGRSWPMAGIFPTVARMQKRLAKLGYIEVAGARGHEFRYSAMDPMPQTITRAYAEPAEGYRVNSVLGSYIHLHFLSSPDFAEGFIRDCALRRANKTK
jgi:cobyrinic acid a,c-diamide synthase